MKLEHATKHPDMVLSNGNLTGLSRQYANYAGAKTNALVNTGKRYFEFRPVYPSAANLAEVYVALCAASFAPAAGANPGAVADAWCLISDGQLIHDNTSNGSGVPARAYASGEWCRCAVDFDAGKAWFGNSAGWDGDPAAGSGPAFTFTPGMPLAAAVIAFSESVPQAAGASFNFGKALFQYAPPAGYIEWDA